SDVCRTLLRHPRLQSASHILAFWPLPDEVDIRASVRELWRLGHDIYLPRVVSDTEMVACPYLGDSSLSPGAFGILEPATPPSTLHKDTVALVPGIAFDKQCHRLGRGRGYYDRFLSLHKPYTIGLCYPFQIVSHVPHDNLDIPVDEVLLHSCP
ncbi:MAG: 5-formyltetrahydrofolate cyclo-ligase, partial [Bacteroidales bacterium]|nr:5-formyltetrahydrofolate cyclo-ligase [Bacteroidales bacterium]